MDQSTKDVLYLSPPFASREQLEAEVEFLDATTSQVVADCPRRAEHQLREGLRPKEEPIFLRAGKAIHAGLGALYSGLDAEFALQELRNAWGYGSDWMLPAGHRYAHLSLGFLETVFKNYVVHAKRYDNFKPIIVHYEDLDLSRVVAAVWRVLPDETVILGESKVAMTFDLDDVGEFVYSGRPDLPIILSGQNMTLDHKSTNSYLSEWYFEQYRFSNQLRGYNAINQELLGKPFGGTLINGIYMGEKAADTSFKGNRFQRYGPMAFLPGHLTEAIRNQYEWRQVLDYYEQRGYYPQHTSKLCSGCSFIPLCAASPSIREAVKEQEYTVGETKFLDI